MKNFLYAISLSSILFFSICVEAAQKIAIVNLSGIFEKLPQRLIIAKKLEHEFQSRAKYLQKQQLELQNKIQKLERDSSIMGVNERHSLENDIRIKRELFSSKLELFEQDRRHRQVEERDKLLQRIQNAVRVIAKHRGYDIVIDSSAIAFVSKIKDITAAVLKQVK